MELVWSDACVVVPTFTAFGSARLQGPRAPSLSTLRLGQAPGQYSGTCVGGRGGAPL